MSGFPLVEEVDLRWPRRSWDKADNPYWRAHVGSWFRSSLEAEEYCRRHKLSTVSFERWARRLLTPKDLRKRAEYLRELRKEKQKRRVRRTPRRKQNTPPRRRYGARTDNGPLALYAFWGMHVEAMNRSGMGLAEYAAVCQLFRELTGNGRIHHLSRHSEMTRIKEGARQ